VFENRVLRGIFGPKRDEVTGVQKNYIMRSNDIYFSSTIVRVIKLRRMKWLGHVSMGRVRACTGFWWGNLRERDVVGDPGIDGRIILTLCRPVFFPLYLSQIINSK
jgi:hypothetical protein